MGDGCAKQPVEFLGGMLHGSVLYGADDYVADLVLALLPTIGGKWTQFTALGVVRKGRLCGGVVFHDYNPVAGDIRVSAAFQGSTWCLPETLQRLVDYPVRQLKCRRITMLIAADNAKSVRFAERCGARLEGTLRRGYDEATDRLLYGILLPDELRLPMRPRHG